MKKIAKLSLVAAMALTAANAGSLEEAIKGVDISGNITYEYQDLKDKKGDTSDQTNEYDAELTVKVPVNDMTKAIVKFDMNDDEGNGAANSNKNVDIEDAYFQFTPGFATINLGQQNIPGPFTDGAQGTGIVALVPVGPVTAAAGYFNNHNVGTVGEKNAVEVALLGNFGPVSAEAWYADVADVLSVYNVKASGTVGPVSVSTQYSQLEEDATGAKKDKEFNIEAEAGFGIATVSAAYVSTGKDNDYGVAIDQDSDATSTWALEQLVVVDKRAASIYKIGASADVTSNVNLAVDYAAGDFKAFGATDKRDIEELLFTAKYAMSKNFNIRALYSLYEEDADAAADDVETNYGAVEFKYTF